MNPATWFRRLLGPAAALPNRASAAAAPSRRSTPRPHEPTDPLRNLTPDSAQALLQAGERGDYATLQWAYRLVEKRDPVLTALVARYEGGLLKLDWTIKTLAGADPALARAQAAALRAAYDRLDNLRDALRFLVLARFRGFAHLELWRDAEGEVAHLEPVPQWYWTRAGHRGPWAYDASAGLARGELVPLDPARFLVREVDRPVDELALLVHLRRTRCQDQWDEFLEVYAVPAMFVIGPAGVPPDIEDQLIRQIGEVIGNSRGYLPYGSQLATVPFTGRGVNPFRTYLKALDEALVLAATGGKLSVLSEPGVGQQAGQVHWQVWREIMQAEAMQLSETLQRQFDAPFLARRFPGQPVLAYFELCAAEETDVGAVVDHAARLAAAGYRLDPAQLSEKTGYRLEAAPE